MAPSPRHWAVITGALVSVDKASRSAPTPLSTSPLPGLSRIRYYPTIKPWSWFDRALKSASLPEMTIHDLRHTAASLAISAGANVKAVQKMLGHASAAMTLDTYADLFDDDLNTVAVRLNEAAISSNVVRMWSEAQQIGATIARR